ncbi:translation initiation factor IF-2-like [Panicum virgatum]|uniref:translation initiation factor IF-2-like n=1 Tax=Panicum virgatum TaxID=38727 RepID=UPI0019D5A289|nr:translation initiation factor IF-2-like [Panicum virgatum]
MSSDAASPAPAGARAAPAAPPRIDGGETRAGGPAVIASAARAATASPVGQPTVAAPGGAPPHAEPPALVEVVIAAPAPSPAAGGARAAPASPVVDGVVVHHAVAATGRAPSHRHRSWRWTSRRLHPLRPQEVHVGLLHHRSSTKWSSTPPSRPLAVRRRALSHRRSSRWSSRPLHPLRPPEVHVRLLRPRWSTGWSSTLPSRPLLTVATSGQGLPPPLPWMM